MQRIIKAQPAWGNETTFDGWFALLAAIIRQAHRDAAGERMGDTGNYARLRVREDAERFLEWVQAEFEG